MYSMLFSSSGASRGGGDYFRLLPFYFYTSTIFLGKAADGQLAIVGEDIALKQQCLFRIYFFYTSIRWFKKS
jgi:hypothetical protein